MGKHDNRLSPKMKQRTAQSKLKARIARKKAAGKGKKASSSSKA
jgi:hypothetical protein